MDPNDRLAVRRLPANEAIPRSLFVIFLVLTMIRGGYTHAQRLSRDYNVGLRVNQVGYTPRSTKVCVAPGKLTASFQVISLETGEVVHTSTFRPGPADLGQYSLGDFSPVTRPGYYYVRSDTLRSYPFEISATVYERPVDMIVGYFSRQRCGSSTTGFLSPCHVDDGVRIDNGKHQDVSGGWHDASDLRKWVGATIYGLIGLGRTYELQSNGQLRRKILEEMRWGNRYFLSMQEPEGYVMSFVGGDVRKHSDSNRWTDNEVGPEGGDLTMTRPNAGTSNQEMLIFGKKDDRVIETKALDLVGQFNFVTAEALMARLTASVDSAYSQQCLKAAKSAFAWSSGNANGSSTDTIGASLQASLELYRATGDRIYRDFAIAQASLLEKLQVRAPDGNPEGFFRVSLDDGRPHKDIWHGCQQFISLCELVELFPSHEKADDWKQMIRRYARGYALFLARRNSFGIVPFGLFAGQDPGGNRKVGPYWYRYFMPPDPAWWVGINAHLASTGVGLLKASRILDDPQLHSLAQRQFDWIIGVNPFNSSTMAGVGYNHPRHFPGSTYYPLTPVIPGAVMNGLGGDHHDETVIGNGNWQVSEYWTPMVAYAVWLMSELSHYE